MTKKDQAFELFSQDKKPSDPEVKALALAPKTRYNYYQLWKKLGGAIGSEGEEGKQAPGKVIPKVLKGGLPVTDSLSQTTFLQFIPHVLQLPLTVPMSVSYMCAVKNGYQGDFSDWISLASLDFWKGRGVDMYTEVGGISEGENDGDMQIGKRAENDGN